MNLPFKIARRYLFSAKSTNAINVISGISSLAIMIGTMALVIVLSAFNGLDKTIRSLYSSFNPDLKVELNEGKLFLIDQVKVEAISKIEGVKAVAPSLEEKALLRKGDSRHIATMKGVPENFQEVISFQKDSLNFRGGFHLDAGDINYTVVGIGVQMAFRVKLDDPEPLDIYIPKKGRVSLTNALSNFKIRTVVPSGTFTIQDEYNNYFFVPYAVAEELLEATGKASQLEIAVEEGGNIKKIKEQVAQILGAQFAVKDQYEQDVTLTKAVKTERAAVIAITSFILMVASFNIIGALLMLVIEKRKDIGVLRSMGATKGFIQKLFLAEGMLITALGFLSGLVLGVLVCVIQIVFKPLKMGGNFVVDAFPIDMRITDFLLIFCIVMVIGLLASWLPAKRAANSRYLIN